MSSWQHAPPSYGRHNGVYAAPKVQQPVQLKRQASDLKSMYPITRWCATYVDTKGSGSGNDWADDNLDVTSPIPSTNVYLPMDLEQSILTQIEEYESNDKEILEKLDKCQQEVQESKQQEESARNQKIDTFMTFTSITDRDRAVKLLEQNEWDLQKAAAQQFASSPDVTVAEGNGPGANANGHSPKAVIRLILPDNRQYTYQMDGNDTFWGVYGRLLQSVPELASKAFSLELSNGHILNENEFDQTLTHAQLVPRGDIRIKY
eukprot:CAMPEP_0197021330 /NCGR_PEP_ID=MMETSP1384-20130603/2195_1 /TAXON_ID=29189 /ORGANISM="Ammonia sp." /LENGTH=261 /DNA_ID=CAMNT_0042449131 /DNA_START=126 /DNA_END=911 /DNA_ORIENTATION=-